MRRIATFCMTKKKVYISSYQEEPLCVLLIWPIFIFFFLLFVDDKCMTFLLVVFAFSFPQKFYLIFFVANWLIQFFLFDIELIRYEYTNCTEKKINILYFFFLIRSWKWKLNIIISCFFFFEKSCDSTSTKTAWRRFCIY
jgi:hypothetical protein